MRIRWWHRKGWITIAVFLGIIARSSVIDPVYAQYEKETAEPIVSRIIIDVQGIPGDASQWESLARNLIFLQEGHVFSAKRFQDSLDALKASHLFKAIAVPDPDWGEKKITLQFKVTPFGRVKDIKIHGAFPLMEREILNAMQLYPGDAYLAEKLPAKGAALTRLFKKEGYIAPVVKITAEEDSIDGNFVVYVNINKGNFFRIKRGIATGCNSFFILTREQVKGFHLPKRFLTPILPSPRDLEIDEIQADKNGDPHISQCKYLLSCNLPENEVESKYPSLWAYLESGMKDGINERYLCRHREPWYSQVSRGSR